jgi:hypothetical protein
MPDKKPPRLVIGQKRDAVTPQRQGIPRVVVGGRRTVDRPTLVDSPDSAIITLGRDVDNGSQLAVTQQQLCSGSYILGVQGVGKSTLLEQIACQLLEQDESLIVFDPHGQLIDNIVRRMPRRRLRDTFHLDLKDRDNPFALNVFACANPDDEEERDRTRNRVTHAFEKLWPETQRGVYFKKLLRHVIILLIEHPGLTLADVPRLLRDGALRSRYTDRLQNTGSRDFWQFDYDALSPQRQITESTPLLTRVDELLAEPVIKRILCQPQSTVDLRALIEARQNLFVSLPINEDAYAKAAGLVGVMLMSLVYGVTFSFADASEAERPGFSLIVDEFQNFATDEYARLFSQGRKFKVKQFLAHQFRGQLDDATTATNKDATLSAFTKVIFQVTEPDSRALGSLFVDLEERRQPTNLAIEVLDKLERHPSPVVKEFAAKYVWPLQAAAKDRRSTTKLYLPQMHRNEEIRYSTSHRYMDYNEWRAYMFRYYHGYIDPKYRSHQEHQEIMRILEHPQQGIDYIYAPPMRDFGAGYPVVFNPAHVQDALELFNRLLYNVQKTRMHCRDVEKPAEALNPEALNHYVDNVRNVIMLEVLFTPLLRFDLWRDPESKAKDSPERLKQLWENINQGEPPHVAAALKRLRRFHRDIEEVVDALISQPITQGGEGIRPADVAMSLRRLPLRQAYVLIGNESYGMKTLPLEDGVGADEADRRRVQLREQTRRKLCRPVSTIREQPAVTGEPEDVQAPAEQVQQPRQQEDAAAAESPRIRRSRPLP